MVNPRSRWCRPKTASENRLTFYFHSNGFPRDSERITRSGSEAEKRVFAGMLGFLVATPRFPETNHGPGSVLCQGVTE